MEVLPKTFDPARIGAHSLFADPVPFAGPTGSPMISSKWKKNFPHKAAALCALS